VASKKKFDFFSTVMFSISGFKNLVLVQDSDSAKVPDSDWDQQLWITDNY
jgi:hypothetical protein